LPFILGTVDDPGLSFDLEAHDRFREIGQSFLGEKGSDDIAGQIFHGLFFPGMDAGTTKDLKAGMFPGFQ
jgi:hypothetical protein